MVGIKIGETITFEPTGVDVKVVSDNTIEYENRIYKLSAFVGTYLPDEKRCQSNAYQGPKFFTYHNKHLTDLRIEMEGIEGEIIEECE